MTVRAQSAVFTGTHRSSQPDPAPAPVERSPTASVRIPIAVFDDHAALAAALPAVPARAASSVLTRAAVHAPSPGRRSEGVVLESWALPYDDPNDPFATPTAPATLAADALAADALVDLTAEARAWLVEVLGAAVRQGASDVHVHAGESVRMRRFGRLWPISDKPLPAEVVHFGLRALLPEDERVVLDRHGQVDCSLTLPGVGRFRANVYRQHKGTDAVFRVVKLRPPTLPTLHLPPELAALTTFTQGIVLVTGPAASGKSSTLAALVHMINEERSEHVVTIEDPIEVLHSSIRCVVNQRQAGRDTRGFARALKAALREDPDVIVIGEMRDRETAQLALTAAETGHLVLATLHTQSAVSTVNRVVGEFPPNQQPQVRGMLSESLRAVVSQRLLPRKDGTGVVPAVEVLRATPAVANLIRESRTHQLRSVMQTGAALGMQTLDASLTDLVARGVVGADDARRVADDPRSFTQLPRTASHPPTPVGA
ncbi:MAG: type IV pilus twitching motility protein PilT [Deltaproteobacteria bacterium]|nr:type IV pilus twitching motility protein PilT [Deltaproteobacteria bacterium]